MLFSELYKIMVKKVTFTGFRGVIEPIAPPPGSDPVQSLLQLAPAVIQRPFTSNSLFTSILTRTGWVGVPRLTLFPGAGNPSYATGVDCDET